MLILKNLFTTLKCLASVGTVLALSACASMTGGDFSCPAPDGFRCMNPVEVYEATNHTSNLDEVSESKKGRKQEAAQSIVVQPVAVAAPSATAVGPDRCCNPVLTGLSVGANDSLSLARPTAQIAPTRQEAEVLSRGVKAASAMPTGDAYRESAKIMRIFVAPWEDEQGDLHMGGIIYSEIEPRKWRVGQRMPEAANTFSLLRGQAAAADDEVASNEPASGTTSNNFNPQR
ncbi:type IV conjugative transfer system lipoprotein TraV [Pseudoxanthomonas japonensis]|uniref:type IV conjugative transfer system lipoprotein TraV n=1 Tax=Pseudoxanthomonas japonensis TaxID=69284 RepID=UPI00374A18FE